MAVEADRRGAERVRRGSTLGSPPRSPCSSGRWWSTCCSTGAGCSPGSPPTPSTTSRSPGTGPGRATSSFDGEYPTNCFEPTLAGDRDCALVARRPTRAEPHSDPRRDPARRAGRAGGGLGAPGPAPNWSMVGSRRCSCSCRSASTRWRWRWRRPGWPPARSTRAGATRRRRVAALRDALQLCERDGDARRHPGLGGRRRRGGPAGLRGDLARVGPVGAGAGPARHGPPGRRRHRRDRAGRPATAGLPPVAPRGADRHGRRGGRARPPGVEHLVRRHRPTRQRHHDVDVPPAGARQPPGSPLAHRRQHALRPRPPRPGPRLLPVQRRVPLRAAAHALAGQHRPLRHLRVHSALGPAPRFPPWSCSPSRT